MPPETTRALAPTVPGCDARSVKHYALRPLIILRAYRRGFLPYDLIAGLTVAAVAIPQAIAYASIAELPPHYGLYTAAVAAVVGSLWGCSRFLATGPVNAVSLLVLPVLMSVAVPGTPKFLLAASLIAVMVGVLNISLALLRFGALVTLASRAVLIGFTAGAAVHIAVGQVRHLLGLDVAAMPELYRTASVIIAEVGAVHRTSLAIGLGTLILVMALRRLGPRIPAALLGIALAALAVRLFGLEEQGVRVVGAIPRSLPPATWAATGLLPDLHLIRSLVVGSMAVAALGLVEAVAASQTLARRSGDRLDSNQEFFGQGLANIAAGLLSGYPCSGSFTRSSLAHQSGAHTNLAGVFTGLAILAGMLLFAPYARTIPRAAIAAVLLVVAWGMVDRRGIRRVFRSSRSEAAITTATFAATLALPLDFAVLAGVVFSLAFFVIRSSLPRVFPVVPDPTFRHFVHHPDLPVCPQLGVMNIRGPLFFGAVYHLEEELRHNLENHPGQNILVLRMHGVDICDLSGIEMLESTVNTYRRLGGDVFLVRPREPVLNMMRDSGFLDESLGEDHILEQEGAVEFLFDNVLDPAVCIYECEQRVFAECQALEKHPYDLRLPPAPRHVHVHARHVSVRQFQELAGDTRAVVIDIREQEEYLAGHVPGASLLPLRLLPEKGSELPRDRNVLLVCRSGRRSTRALHMLEEMDYENVYGLKGGILAWRAAGLPISRAVASDAAATADLLDLQAGSGYERLALARMGIKSRIERLTDKLQLLSNTENLHRIRGTIERLLDQLPESPATGRGCVRLDPSLPVLVVSDSHGQRGALFKLLRDRYLGGEASNLESLVQGRLQILLLGDLMHSESKSRWQAIEDEYVSEFASSGEDIGPTPVLDREMADCLGLAAMVMLLQKSLAGFHCLKGNHDNLLNADDLGNGKVFKYVPWPGEGEIVRNWTLVRFGATFAGKYTGWENNLPVFAIFDDPSGGLRFVASHSEPDRPYTLMEIEKRSDEVVFGLTWSRNMGRYAPEVLENIFARQWRQSRYFASHTGSEEGIIHVPENRFVIFNKPRHLVAALVLPGVRGFDVHMVSGK